MEIGDKIEVKIEKLSLGGDGIARVPSAYSGKESHFVVFVPYTVPGDEALVKIIEHKKNFARGKILKVNRNGVGRKIPPCPYYFNPSLSKGGSSGWCGGCDFQHLEYLNQTDQKQMYLKEVFEKIAQISSPPILPIIKAPPNGEWHYRNKIQLPVRKIQGRVVAGFFSPSSHDLVPIQDCLIHSEPMIRFANWVVQKINDWRLEAYSEDAHRGWLRHLYIREDFQTGQMAVVFVTLGDYFPRKEEWVREIHSSFPNVSGLLQNVNHERTNVILGRNWKTIFGKDYLIERLQALGKGGADLTLKVSASSFFQVNTRMAQELYKLARDFAVEKNGGNPNTLFDLYCGVGGIALASAPYFQKVVGVDDVHSSIRDAQTNLRYNHAENVQFYCQDADSFLKDQISVAKQHGSLTVVLDPPRSGVLERTLKKLTQLKPRQIVYVSCEPSTLARDVRVLCGSGYSLIKVQGVDLFPQSSHIESVSLLQCAR